MAKRRISNPLALAVLACVVQRPMHPYEIASTLREQNHDTAVKLNFGSLYNVVESLCKAGFVDVQSTTRQGNRPERTVYAITPAGREELARWLRELLSTPTKEYPMLGAGLTFMSALAPDDALAQLALRSHRLEGQIRELGEALRAQRTPDGSPLRRIYQVEDEYELALKEAELEWIRKLIREISDGSLDGVDEWRRFHETSG
jgi:DNA-binding PadR family transcriptional regulator